METLIFLILFGLTIMFLPYILAGALIVVAGAGFVLALVAMAFSKLKQSLFGK
jgi:hypothetical protein